MSYNFDVIAPVYDKLAGVVFGDAIRIAQLSILSFIPQGATILIIGGGTGWYLEELLKKRAIEKVVYIEASQRMLKIAQQKIAPYTHANPNLIEFRFGTEASLQKGEKYDVIVTPFLLDLFRQPRVNQLVHVCKSVLKENGIWLFSDFDLSKVGSGYWWKKLLLQVMYTFFRLCCNIEARTLPDYEQAFSINDMHCVTSSCFFHQLIISRVYARAKGINTLNNV